MEVVWSSSNIKIDKLTKESSKSFSVSNLNYIKSVVFGCRWKEWGLRTKQRVCKKYPVAQNSMQPQIDWVLEMCTYPIAVKLLCKRAPLQTFKKNSDCYLLNCWANGSFIEHPLLLSIYPIQLKNSNIQDNLRFKWNYCDHQSASK